MSKHVNGYSSILLSIHFSNCHLWISYSRLTLRLLVNVWQQAWRNSWFVVDSSSEWSTNFPTHQLEQQHFAVSPAVDNTDKADGPSHTSLTLVRIQQDCSLSHKGADVLPCLGRFSNTHAPQTHQLLVHTRSMILLATFSNLYEYFLRRTASTTTVTRLKSQAPMCGGGDYRTLRRHPRNASLSLFHSSPLNRIIRLHINFPLMLFRSTLEVHYTFRKKYTTGENAKIWLLIGTSYNFRFPITHIISGDGGWIALLPSPRQPAAPQHDHYHKEQNSCNLINERI